MTRKNASVPHKACKSTAALYNAFTLCTIRECAICYYIKERIFACFVFKKCEKPLFLGKNML